MIISELFDSKFLQDMKRFPDSQRKQTRWKSNDIDFTKERTWACQITNEYDNE